MDRLNSMGGMRGMGRVGRMCRSARGVVESPWRCIHRPWRDWRCSQHGPLRGIALPLVFCRSLSSIFVLAWSIPAIVDGLKASLGLVWWEKVGGVAGREFLGSEKFEGRGRKKKVEDGFLKIAVSRIVRCELIEIESNGARNIIMDSTPMSM